MRYVTYLPRVVDQQVAHLLTTSSSVIIEGPRAVGKTLTSKRFSSSDVNLSTDQSARNLAEMGSKLVLEDGTTRATGAGRMSRVKMRPLSLFESGHSSGVVSLEGLFAGSQPSAADKGMDLGTIIERICIGGWPLFVNQNVKDARLSMQSYLDEISRMDVREASGIKHDPEKVRKVLRSLARNVGAKAPITTIASDSGMGGVGVYRSSVSDYLGALDRLMIIEDLPAWGPHIRSKAIVRDSATRFFVDPCLAVASSQASPQTLLADLEATGLLFENLVVRDIRVYVQNFRGRLSQYRDSNGAEVDVIIETFDGKWAGMEVKLGVNQVDAASKKLLEFAKNVDTSRSGSPVFLAVVTSTGYAYVRQDGVYVLPIGLLGP